MTPDDFKQSLRALEITQEEFARLVGAARRTAVYWAQESVPGPVATIVRLLQRRPELRDVLAEIAAETAAQEAR